MKLSVNETKLTGLRARTCATIDLFTDTAAILN